MKKVFLLLVVGLFVLGGCFSSSGGGTGDDNGGDTENPNVKTTVVDVSGTGNIYFEIEEETAETVKLSLNVDNSYQINNAEIKVVYDNSILEIVTTEDGMVDYTSTNNFTLVTEDIINSNGKFILLYSEDITSNFNGQLGSIEFKKLDSSETTVEIEYINMTAIDGSEVINYINLDTDNLEID